MAHEFATQLSAEKDRHRETAVQLAAATAKIEYLAAELARLNAERGPHC
ncbi:hypothetical protein ACFOD9_12165 [Novosphingobium bradum]|uniref:Uncharacterized protein n=1 Tax=Novosphingobium bradum TaxID=1737444 RepID=A0ABV7IQR4_9SPHN